MGCSVIATAQHPAVLAVLAVAAVLGYAGLRAAADGGPEGWRSVASAGLPVVTLLAGWLMFVVLAICNVGDDVTQSCTDATAAARVVFYGYLGLVGAAWAGSVVAGLRAHRARQTVWLRAAVVLVVAVPPVAVVGEWLAFRWLA
jgi:hypothetical protein